MYLFAELFLCNSYSKKRKNVLIGWGDFINFSLLLQDSLDYFIKQVHLYTAFVSVISINTATVSYSEMSSELSVRYLTFLAYSILHHYWSQELELLWKNA